MRGLRVKLAIGVAVLGAVVVAAAATAGDRGRLDTRLSGYEEVPAISTDAGGIVPRGDRARRRRDRVRAALRRPERAQSDRRTSTSGSAASTAGSPRSCAPTSATARRAPRPARRRRRGSPGTITADAGGRAPAPQGIAAREFDELVDALRAGVGLRERPHGRRSRAARSAGRSAATAADRGAAGPARAGPPPSAHGTWYITTGTPARCSSAASVPAHGELVAGRAARVRDRERDAAARPDDAVRTGPGASSTAAAAARPTPSRRGGPGRAAPTARAFAAARGRDRGSPPRPRTTPASRRGSRCAGSAPSRR